MKWSDYPNLAKDLMRRLKGAVDCKCKCGAPFSFTGRWSQRASSWTGLTPANDGGPVGITRSSGGLLLNTVIVSGAAQPEVGRGCGVCAIPARNRKPFTDECLTGLLTCNGLPCYTSSHDET